MASFFVRYYEFDVGMQTISLHPRPTTVEYPDARLFNRRETVEGKVVLQRPLHDNRSRKWIWTGYRPTVPLFQAQWDVLSQLEARSRWDAGYSDLTVGIWENGFPQGGFGQTTDGLPPDLDTYSNLQFTQVKFLQVQHHLRSGGGPVAYDSSEIEFVIEDENFRGF